MRFCVQLGASVVPIGTRAHTNLVGIFSSRCGKLRFARAAVSSARARDCAPILYVIVYGYEHKRVFRSGMPPPPTPPPTRPNQRFSSKVV